MFGNSQGFGYGDAAAATQDGPKRAARQEDKQTCIPVTSRILHDAFARHADSQEVLIHGTEASIVHLVGVVEALVEQSTMLEFQLNDGSGRIKVRYYSTGSGITVDGLALGRYISVVGNVRTTPAPHISAMSLQPVASADEVSYHMIAVAHAALRLRNPSKAPALRTNSAVVDTVTPSKQASPGLGLGAGSNLSPVKQDAPMLERAELPALPVQTPPKTDLRGSVIGILRQVQESGNDEGIDFSTLVARLAPGQSSSDKVRDVLSKLVEEAEVFNTIDEDHFAIL